MCVRFGGWGSWPKEDSIYPWKDLDFILLLVFCSLMLKLKTVEKQTSEATPYPGDSFSEQLHLTV